MIQKVQNLILLLERMLVLYERTFGIFEREKHALIAFDFDDLLTVIREKDEVNSVLQSLDEDRLRIQDQFSLIMQTDPELVTLKFVSDSLKEQLPLEAKRLSQLRDEMQQKIEALRSKIRVNKAFTEKSIENLQLIAANLSSAIRGSVNRNIKPSKTYSQKARVSDSKQQTGSIIEKRL